LVDSSVQSCFLHWTQFWKSPFLFIQGPRVMDRIDVLFCFSLPLICISILLHLLSLPLLPWVSLSLCLSLRLWSDFLWGRFIFFCGS
jgi:hypothetical protein